MRSGRPTHNRGPSYFTQDNLNGIVTAADAAGLTVHIHAIGDRAVRSALDAFADAGATTARSDNRDQIAHLELVDPADFPRFKELGVIANFQLLWAERDDYIDNATIKYLGPQRSRYLYPARSLRDAGALIAGGSDWGVSSFDAFDAMEHAITRSERRGAARAAARTKPHAAGHGRCLHHQRGLRAEAGAHHRQHRGRASAAISSCSTAISSRSIPSSCTIQSYGNLPGRERGIRGEVELRREAIGASDRASRFCELRAEPGGADMPSFS